MQGKNQFLIIAYHAHMYVLGYGVKGNEIILILTGNADSKVTAFLSSASLDPPLLRHVFAVPSACGRIKVSRCFLPL